MQGYLDSRCGAQQDSTYVAVPQDASYGAVQQQRTADQHQMFHTLLPIVRHLLQVVLENEFEQSAHAVTNHVLYFTWPDGRGGTNVQYWYNQGNDAILNGRILEAFAHWVRAHKKDLDSLVEMSQVGHSIISEQLEGLKAQLEQACHYQSHWGEIIAEFVHSVVCELLGPDATCLGGALTGMLLGEFGAQEVLAMVEWPTTLLAHLVSKLEEIQARVSKVVIEIYSETALFSCDDAKHQLMMFIQHFTVEASSGTLEVHDSPDDGDFQTSQFRVKLVNSYGCLIQLLHHLENTLQVNNTGGGSEVVLSVDFEGVKLNRHGALCLVQMTCSDDPTLVYVLDVFVLGHRAFTLQTPSGTCMKGLLEDQSIRKVWFDPRNDVDALYHQFGILPSGIFDLQLAEVADRRNRGLNVSYVQGLQKCITQCAALEAEQKVFAEKINMLGKNMYEPTQGGNYEVFRWRPLNPAILVYAAHDARYLNTLYEQYVHSIGPAWVQRVLDAGGERGRWCLNDYVFPRSEAPDF